MLAINILTNLESILASNRAFLMRLTIHLSASSGLMFNLSASMLNSNKILVGISFNTIRSKLKSFMYDKIHFMKGCKR